MMERNMAGDVTDQETTRWIWACGEVPKGKDGKQKMALMVARQLHRQLCDADAASVIAPNGETYNVSVTVTLVKA
jgi:hypothetical protein